MEIRSSHEAPGKPWSRCMILFPVRDRTWWRTAAAGLMQPGTPILQLRVGRKRRKTKERRKRRRRKMMSREGELQLSVSVHVCVSVLGLRQVT